MRGLEILVVLAVIIAIVVLIVYGERSVTSHWVFWVGIALLVGVFLGVPAMIISGVNSMNL